MCDISVVVPLYMCSESVEELTSRLKTVFSTITERYEIILVNDGSPQNDWQIAQRLATEDGHIISVNLSRRFGQHIAITAGLNYCRGSWIVVMDGDLQDKPEFIPNLYAKAQEGYDVVFARRAERKDTFIKKLTSKWFLKIFNYLAGSEGDSTLSNFGIYSKQVIDNYLKFGEHYRIFPLLVKWQGFNIATIDVDHGERLYGKSSYNYPMLFSLALDVVVSHTNKPLKMSIQFGFLLALFSLTYLCWLVIRKFIFDVPLGWTSIMTSIFFVGGLLFANIGLLGLYIGKIYDETKGRPLFLVREVVGEHQPPGPSNDREA